MTADFEAAAGKRSVTAPPDDRPWTEDGQQAIVVEDRIRASRRISVADSRLQKR